MPVTLWHADVYNKEKVKMFARRGAADSESQPTRVSSEGVPGRVLGAKSSEQEI